VPVGIRGTLVQLYAHRWLEPNLTFLKEALNAPGVTEALSRAVDRLIDHSEHELAARIREDLPLPNDAPSPLR
jgi:hypothetical protein